MVRAHAPTPKNQSWQSGSVRIPNNLPGQEPNKLTESRLGSVSNPLLYIYKNVKLLRLLDVKTLMHGLKFIFLKGKVFNSRIRIGSVFRSYLDPDPYSEYGSGSSHANIG